MEIPFDLPTSLIKYQSLYAFFRGDYCLGEDAYGWGLAESIISNTLRRMRIDPAYQEDCRQEIITTWLGTPFDLTRPRTEILSYATRSALMAVQMWRRSVVVTTYAPQSQSPEPRAIPLDELFGEDLDRFVEATLSQALDPATAIGGEQITPQIDLSQVDFPEAENMVRIRQALKRLWEGQTKDQVAKEFGVTVRTIDRWIVRVREHNNHRTRRELREAAAQTINNQGSL